MQGASCASPTECPVARGAQAEHNHEHNIQASHGARTAHASAHLGMACAVCASKPTPTTVVGLSRGAGRCALVGSVVDSLHHPRLSSVSSCGAAPPKAVCALRRHACNALRSKSASGRKPTATCSPSRLAPLRDRHHISKTASVHSPHCSDRYHADHYCTGSDGSRGPSAIMEKCESGNGAMYADFK